MRDERLLKFAERLHGMRCVDDPDIREAWIQSSGFHQNLWYCVTYNMNYFLELPVIFNEWSYYVAGDEVEIKKYPKYMGMAGMVKKFFNLRPSELTHLFDVMGNQNIDLYGGVILNKYSPPQDIAFNIIEFLKVWDENNLY